MRKLEELNKSYFGPRVSDGAGVFVAGFVFMFIFQIIALIVAGIFKVNVEEPPLWFNWVMLLINCCAFILAVFAFGKMSNKPLLKECRIERKITWKQTALLPAIIIVSIMAFLPLAEGFVKLVELITKESQASAMNVGQTWWEILISVFFMCVLPAVGEEILFRGGVSRGLKRKNYVFGMIMTGFLFSIFHGNATQTVHQFLFGMVLTFIYFTTGSLLASIIAHFLNNFFAIMLGLALDPLFANSTLPVGGTIAIYVVVSIVGFVSLYFLLRLYMKVCKEAKGLPQNTDKMAWAKDLGKAFTLNGIKDNYTRLNNSLKALFDDPCDSVSLDGDIVKKVESVAIENVADSNASENSTNMACENIATNDNINNVGSVEVTTHSENNKVNSSNDEIDKLLEESNKQTIRKRKRFDIMALVVAIGIAMAAWIMNLFV